MDTRRRANVAVETAAYLARKQADGKTWRRGRPPVIAIPGAMINCNTPSERFALT